MDYFITEKLKISELGCLYCLGETFLEFEKFK